MANNVEFTSHRDEVMDAMEHAVRKALTEIGIEAENHAKTIVEEKGAVDTGRLKNSITHAVGDHNGEPAVYIGTNVEYAPYIELGARGRPPRAYLKPAVEDFRDEYKEIVEDNLKNG